MSRHLFDVREHVFDGQHVREYPRATAHSQEDVLKLCAKQYVPKSNGSPQPGDVTIVAAHANGFVKEIYEPLWDDLLAAAATHGVRIRSIWIADVANQGQSGIRNEEVLGNDPSWNDHARDLLLMVNTFRRDLPRPLVGLGHSFGGTVLTQLALLHPRLFTSLVLLDPVLGVLPETPGHGYRPLEQSAVRRDRWPSRAAAAAAFARSPFYASWDPRVLALWVEHGLRDLPTALYPEDNQDGVTLTTTKHQEVFTFLRPTWQGVDMATGRRVFDRARVPDISDASLAAVGPDHRLYRAEMRNTAAQLGQLRPGVCFVFGGTSPLATPPVRAALLAQTGVGAGDSAAGGSGGAPAGRVRGVVLPDTGHLVAQEQPGACAEHAAAWIAEELGRWRVEEAELAVSWFAAPPTLRPEADKRRIDAEWQGFIDHKPMPGKKARL